MNRSSNEKLDLEKFRSHFLTSEYPINNTDGLTGEYYDKLKKAVKEKRVSIIKGAHVVASAEIPHQCNCDHCEEWETIKAYASTKPFAKKKLKKLITEYNSLGVRAINIQFKEEFFLKFVKQDYSPMGLFKGEDCD